MFELSTKGSNKLMGFKMALYEKYLGNWNVVNQFSTITRLLK